QTLAVGMLTLFAVGCRTTSGHSKVKSDWLSQDDKGQGEFVIDWPCGFRQGPDGKGILQDEYCEWERKSIDQQKDLAGQSLSCDFRSSFDMNRQWWLPMRDDSDEFYHTGNNTNDALITLVRDCTSSQDAHCDKSKDPEKLVACVPDRASDPEVCRQLNQLLFKNGKNIAPGKIPAADGLPTPKVRSSEDPTDSLVGIQLGLLSPLPPFCKFDVDPKLKASMLNAKWTEEKIANFASSEKTYIHCDVKGELLEAYPACDSTILTHENFKKRYASK
ncbi:MAG: hypothetical protein NTX25_19490, partial [Proteobacteria bacterium]|nr:hypothetical protein [Pseudomonadota bacterium]